MAKKTRIKTPAVAVRVPQTREAAAADVATIGRLSRDLSRLEADMNDELAAIKDTLDQLEPVAQQPTQARPAQALYSWPLAAALLLSVLLVIRELWPNNRVQRWLSKEHFLQQHPDWRARLKRLRLRRRR